MDVPGDSKVGYTANLCTNNKNKLGVDASAEVPGDVEVCYYRDNLAFSSRFKIPLLGYTSMRVDLDNHICIAFTSRFEIPPPGYTSMGVNLDNCSLI